jgi:WD40 repeat protein
MNRRSGRSVRVAICLAMLVVTAAACVAEQTASSPNGTQSPTLPSASSFGPTPSAGGPGVSPLPSERPRTSASPAPDPSRFPDPAAGIRAHALGRLTGNWIFVGKQVPYPHNIWAEVQIWALPLEAGTPRLAFAYDVSLGGIPEAIFDNTPYLRRQFSPDGTRIVVSVGGELRVVDITSGQVRPLGVSGYFPAWSKDGSRIAFVFFLPAGQVSVPEEAIGVVRADGGPVTDIAHVGYSRQTVEWSPDGSMVLVAQADGIALVDASNGRLIRRLTAVASNGSSFAYWRGATPQIAAATGGCDAAQTTTVIGLDDATTPERTLLDTGEHCPTLSIQDPRWNPVIANELLFVATRANPGAMPNEYRVHLLDTGSGRDTTLGLSAYEATWTWDGAAIAYVAKSATGFYGDSVRIWRRDGGGERVLLTDTQNASFFSIASLSY